jgi:magnesium transporter
MSHPLFAPEIRHLLQTDDVESMRTYCNTLHAATLAEALADDLPVEDVWRFLRTAPIAQQAEIFSYFPIDEQIRLVEGGGKVEMAHLLEEMSSDDRAELLRRLERRVAEGLLRLVDEADRRDIARLVEYPENSAGALVTTDYAWLPANITVEEALDRLRLQAPDTETIYYVYIVDEQRRLLGVVSLRDLILAPRRTLISTIMETNALTVRVTDDQEKVAQDMARYDLLAVPVLDADGRLVGIITHDDVMDVVVEQATEDAHRMGAVGPIEENYLEASFFQLWRSRAFWLSCLFVAELFTFTALAYFEESIAEVVVLSLFVPLCISTGGNSGSQAATLITRAMALGQVGVGDWLRVMRHELAMGLVLGLTLGTIGFFRASFTPASVRGSAPDRHEGFTVTVPADQPLEFVTQTKPGWFGPGGTITTVVLPAGATQVISDAHQVTIKLPEDSIKEKPERIGSELLYRFPPKCSLPREPVSWARLAFVIGSAVACICVWGTLIGSMLPIVFKRMGVDPGIASSPFVATFVDVTGIVIYFTISRIVLGI